MEAGLVRWRAINVLQESFTRIREDIFHNIERSTSHWHRPTETQRSIDFERSNFGFWSVNVIKVEYIGRNLIIEGKSENLSTHLTLLIHLASMGF